MGDAAAGKLLAGASGGAGNVGTGVAIEAGDWGVAGVKMGAGTVLGEATKGCCRGEAGLLASLAGAGLTASGAGLLASVVGAGLIASVAGAGLVAIPEKAQKPVEVISAALAYPQ